MKKNDLLKKDDMIVRVLDMDCDKVLVVNCINKTMPEWVDKSSLDSFVKSSESELTEQNRVVFESVEELDADSKKQAYEHYTLIAGVLPFVSNTAKRSEAIDRVSKEKNVSKQTIRKYLIQYLIYQNISALVTNKKNSNRPLTKDEKNIRWALNKFFYTKYKNSLKTAYTLMLKEKYCNEEGVLSESYPSFYQFRYYYRKNKNMQKYYISRDGIKSYQRNNRPLTGDKIQEYAPAVGVGMFDSTICDIYLVNDSGELVGRPILTACIDAYSSLCCGYTLSWEGGMYSLRSLVLNVITDKVQWCEKFGVTINKNDWDCDSLPATFVTDMGSEYVSENFEQISELGVTVVNLPSYRPELKGAVEKFFDLIQESYKPYLKGKGVIEPDYLERGAHDYRKDACLTLETFEKIILHCIIYYNSKRIIENFPYTEEMLSERVKPHASDIWNWGKNQIGANLIKTSSKDLMLTLLPRTTGKFSRFGLKVNKLRYHNENYTEEYLKGNSVTVAYNLDDVTSVWVVDKGKYTQFELIDSRFEGKNIDEVTYIQDTQKEIIKYAHDDNIQAKILLAEHIETIANTVSKNEDISTKGIDIAKKKERNKRHIDHMKEGEQYELYY